MKTALITGVTGQDGAYLAKLLIEKQYKVYGFIPRRVNQNLYNLDYFNITNKINFIFGDLTDYSSINNAIKQVRPDELYNLGAMSFVGLSWDQPLYTTQVNGLGCLHFLEAVKNFSPNTKVYQASTSEMFGNNWDKDYTQREDTNFRPRSPYGTSKTFAHQSCVNYRESYGLFTSCGILFNHESPLRGKEFVTRKITDGIAKIKKGLESKIFLGNLDAKRDWGFAGDYVEAMWKMLQHTEGDDFIIATNTAWSIRDFLSIACQKAEIDDWESIVSIDPRFIRPAEVPYLKGDYSKAKKVLGWEPKMAFPDLVALMMEEDLKRYE